MVYLVSQENRLLAALFFQLTSFLWALTFSLVVYKTGNDTHNHFGKAGLTDYSNLLFFFKKVNYDKAESLKIWRCLFGFFCVFFFFLRDVYAIRSTYKPKME